MEREKFTIKQWRQVRNLSQREMAERLGVHVNTYSRMEKEPMQIKIGDLLSICRVLDIDANSILSDPECAENGEGM